MAAGGSAGGSWARRVLTLAALLSCHLPEPACAIDEQQLETWFISPYGLKLNSTAAKELAKQESKPLTECGVTIQDLIALKDMMHSPVCMGIELLDLEAKLLQVAKRHILPQDLLDFYEALSSNYLFFSGLDLPQREAQEKAIALAMARAEVGQLYDLFHVMYGWGGLYFSKKRAQQTAIQLAFAGADVKTYQERYIECKGRVDSDTEAEKQAESDAVGLNLKGVVLRYDKDARLRSSNDFQSVQEWISSPMELRVWNNLAYTAAGLKRDSSLDWEAEYRASPTATQMRILPSGDPGDVHAFRDNFGDMWRVNWADAPELPCKECVPYPLDSEGRAEAKQDARGAKKSSSSPESVVV